MKYFLGEEKGIILTQQQKLLTTHLLSDIK